MEHRPACTIASLPAKWMGMDVVGSLGRGQERRPLAQARGPLARGSPAHATPLQRQPCSTVGFRAAEQDSSSLVAQRLCNSL